MKDIHSSLFAAVAIGVAVLDADNTPPAIDLIGYNGAEIVLMVGVGGITFTGANMIEFKLTHSDDDASYEAVDVGDVLGVESVGRSEEHTSELQSLMRISYAVFCLKKKTYI